MIWFRPELQVLFVCTANRCRSPLAEGLLRHRLRAMGLSGRVQVRSAGSRVAQSGQRPDPRVVELAAESGISLSGIRSRVLTVPMIRRSDFVLVMERAHLDDIARLLADGAVAASAAPRSSGGIAGCPQNVHLLGSFLPLQDEQASDIPDPYFGDRQGIYNVHALIDSALAGFVACLEVRLKNSRDS